jgi:hypothetical protein
MTHTAEPSWDNTIDIDFSDDIAFDGLATHETVNGRRNGGKGRGAE